MQNDNILGHKPDPTTDEPGHRARTETAQPLAETSERQKSANARTGGCPGHAPRPDEQTSPSRKTILPDGGQPDTLTYGDCTCGGTYVLDPTTLDNRLVKFPCDAEGCDWHATLSRGVLDQRLDQEGLDIDDYRPEVMADGGEEIEAEWRLVCTDCDFEDELVTPGHPREGVPSEVEQRVREHKGTTDWSHVVRIEGRRADREIDPSLVTDGGEDIEELEPEQSPEFVGSHSGVEADTCQVWDTDEDEEKPTPCENDATHTQVYYSGEYHYLAACDDCGESDDVEDWEREWSADRSKATPDESGLDGACPECGSEQYGRGGGAARCPDCGFEYEHLTDGGRVEYRASETFQKATRGVSAPPSGHDTADYPADANGSRCENCGHVGHEHEKVKVYPEKGPTGASHYRYLCPGTERVLANRGDD